jgi:hypothetical protein
VRFLPWRGDPLQEVKMEILGKDWMRREFRKKSCSRLKEAVGNEKKKICRACYLPGSLFMASCWSVCTQIVPGMRPALASWRRAALCVETNIDRR